MLRPTRTQVDLNADIGSFRKIYYFIIPHSMILDNLFISCFSDCCKVLFMTSTGEAKKLYGGNRNYPIIPGTYTYEGVSNNRLYYKSNTTNYLYSTPTGKWMGSGLISQIGTSHGTLFAGCDNAKCPSSCNNWFVSDYTNGGAWTKDTTFTIKCAGLIFIFLINTTIFYAKL